MVQPSLGGFVEIEISASTHGRQRAKELTGGQGESRILVARIQKVMDMTHAKTVECSFLIPVVRDSNLSDGLSHEPEIWQKLNLELFARFGGRTLAPGNYSGAYRDPNTGLEVMDESRKYYLAVSEDSLDEVRQLLREACDWFQQKCIYLSVAGQVEFVTKP